MALTRERAEAVFAAYSERHARCDLAGVLALFAPDATVEDPVGAPGYVGLDAIEGFYSGTQARNGPMTIERAGALLVGGDELAVHVRAELEAAGAPPAMDVIYVIAVDEAGRIRSLRAWY
ncbi:MAG: nuclear transport factor 2 family protein [bacterium]|nr:nuclear transport factor 2 family protein [bacterium]